MKNRMYIGQNGIDLIKKSEGCKLTSYKCPAGIWTIGYGNTQYENGIQVKQGETITQQRANELFMLLVDNRYGSAVSNLVRATITQNQFDALTSFAYNVGIGAFEKSTLLRKVNKDPSDITIRDEFAKWNKGGGKVLSGLTTRRKAEADLYFR